MVFLQVFLTIKPVYNICSIYKTKPFDIIWWEENSCFFSVFHGLFPMFLINPMVMPRSRDAFGELCATPGDRNMGRVNILNIVFFLAMCLPCFTKPIWYIVSLFYFNMSICCSVSPDESTSFEMLGGHSTRICWWLIFQGRDSTWFYSKGLTGAKRRLDWTWAGCKGRELLACFIMFPANVWRAWTRQIGFYHSKKLRMRWL